jgi:hypothetical protein
MRDASVSSAREFGLGKKNRRSEIREECGNETIALPTTTFLFPFEMGHLGRVRTLLGF